jgi:hypothetical protein
MFRAVEPSRGARPTTQVGLRELGPPRAQLR